jgi:hypothetical protein
MGEENRIMSIYDKHDESSDMVAYVRAFGLKNRRNVILLYIVKS